MSNIHIYTEAMQPATAYVDNHSVEPILGGWKPEELLFTQCCRKARMAKNCVVQLFYDGTNIWCAHGQGCKHPDEIAAKRKREFDNRSAGQMKRRAREVKP